MQKLIATVTVAILLLSHVNQSFSQESKAPCEVQCDGSLRKAAEAYVTAMFNLDAKGVMAAYDLESREGKAVAEAIGAGIEYAHSTRVFEEAVTRKFGEPGMKLLAKYLEWTSVTSDIEDVKSYLKQHVKLFIGEDGASAIVAMQWGVRRASIHRNDICSRQVVGRRAARRSSQRAAYSVGVRTEQ